jgi:inner membrane protein
MAGFRAFARFPHLFKFEQHDGSSCAWFLDLRFTLGEPDAMLRAPFQYGACLDSGQEQWQLQH